MSSNASGSRPPIDLRDFIDDKRDNPSPYHQEPIYEGFYVEDDTQLIRAARKCRRNHADRSDGIEGGFVNPGFQNQPQIHLYPQHPPNIAYAYYPPQEMQSTGQQQAYLSPSFHDLRSVAATYPPHATTGQYMYVVTLQPQGPAGGRPHAIISQPIMENPPDDHMAYSTCAACCCCW